MSMPSKPAFTTTGMYHEYGRTADTWDFLLADFAVGNATLKSGHHAQLKQVLEFIGEDHQKRTEYYEKIFFGTTPIWTVWSAGYASSTYGGKVVDAENKAAVDHNRALSMRRVTEVTARLQELLGIHPLVVGKQIQYSLLTRGFTDNSKDFIVDDSDLDSAYCRSVRVVLTRPGLPPKEVEIPHRAPTVNNAFTLQQLSDSSLNGPFKPSSGPFPGIPTGTPKAGPLVPRVILEIQDSTGTTARYRFEYFSLGSYAQLTPDLELKGMPVDASPFKVLQDKQVRLIDFAGLLARYEIGPIRGATLELMNGLTTDPKAIALQRPKLPGLKWVTVMGKPLRSP